MPREHGEKGEFVETTTLEDVLGVFDDVEGPVVLSADVADTLGCSRETARRKLEELYDRGDVNRRKVARRVIYWRDDNAGAGSQATREDVETTEDTPDRRTVTATDSGPLAESGLDDALREWDPEEINTETAHTQTRRAVEWLQQQDYRQEKADFQDALADGSTLSNRVWWDRAVRPGLNHLAETGLVDYKRNQGYRWTGNDGRND